MSKPYDKAYLSDCHNAPVYVVGSDEGTCHYECDTCGKSCNFHAADSDGLSGQLRKLMHDMHCTTHMPDCADYCDGDETFLNEVMSLIHQHDQQIIAEAERRLLERVDKEVIGENDPSKVKNIYGVLYRSPHNMAKNKLRRQQRQRLQQLTAQQEKKHE